MFKWVDLKNYKTFACARVEFQLENIDVCVITGSNASGKSCLVEAIEWVLFNTSYDFDVISRNQCNDPVEITLCCVGNGR